MDHYRDHAEPQPFVTEYMTYFDGTGFRGGHNGVPGGIGGGNSQTISNIIDEDYSELKAGFNQIKEHCLGDLAKGALSVALDVAGAIPGFGNAVAATAVAARAVDGIVTYGGPTLEIGTGLESPVGAVSAAAGLGLTAAQASLGSAAKVLPVIGNVLSGLTGLYDAYQLGKTIHNCW